MGKLEQYESLNQILSANEELKKTLIQEGWTDDQTLMSKLDELFGELSECEGLEEKISNLSPEIRQFRSLWSELRFGRRFKNKGKSVKFLTEGYMGERRSGNERKSPDMLVKNEKEVYVEVKRIKEVFFIIQEKIKKDLQEFLSKRGTDFKVVVNIGKELSPAVSASEFKHKEFKEMEKLWKKNFKKFKDKFRKSDPLKTSSISTPEADFKIKEISNKEPKVSLIPNASFKGGEAHKEKLKESLIEKAKKRYDWKGNHRKKLYLIAIFLEESTYGKDWKDFITDMYQSGEIRETKEEYIPGKTKEIREIMSNVSGVILLSRRLEFSVYCNPFAQKEINNPSLESYFE